MSGYSADLVTCECWLQEKDNVKDKLGEARSSLRSLQDDNDSMHQLMAKLQDDKRRLGTRVNKLINNGMILTLTYGSTPTYYVLKLGSR